MRSIYLIRHGEPDFPDGIRRCIGTTDVPLSRNGRCSAEMLRLYFQDHPVERVFTSPLGRARETAQILADGRYPVNIMEGLRELDMGEWENVPLSELKKNLASEPEHGERRTDGVQRFSGCIRKILKETKGDVVVMAHAGINCCYLASLTGISLEVSRALPQPYCGISRIEVSDEDGTKQVSGIGRMPRDVPSDDEIEKIWKHYHTPEKVIAHCRAVADLACEYGMKLRASGDNVRMDLIRSSALLHDVAREKKDHPLAGARCVIREGYPLLAPLIVQHHEWGRMLSEDEVTGWRPSFPADEMGDFRYKLEAEVIYLSDKEVQGTVRIRFEERFEQSRKRCEASEDPASALEGHRRRFLQTRRIKEELQNEINKHG